MRLIWLFGFVCSILDIASAVDFGINYKLLECFDYKPFTRTSRHNHVICSGARVQGTGTYNKHGEGSPVNSSKQITNP
ncbi:hypothetical protein NECAME_05886 [Necator americanus]|uniref:Uncharacterized protein n=1 Tax=Necator americanus TaxID=51031 RepID=W2TZW9_NECAM|nr:hypothetical protein NECAME_05886 [Necator americanus]ETN86582.1 hypothetical protein NECAME_05886 [Necator americanus]